MFIVGGFNAYPAEIEGFLMEHPAVAQAAVIGVPDERLGQVGKAFVVRKNGRDVAADDLIAWSRERMAGFKVPQVRRVSRRSAAQCHRQGDEGPVALIAWKHHFRISTADLLASFPTA